MEDGLGFRTSTKSMTLVAGRATLRPIGRFVATFASSYRLPADVIPAVVDFWANVGMY